MVSKGCSPNTEGEEPQDGHMNHKAGWDAEDRPIGRQLRTTKPDTLGYQSGIHALRVSDAATANGVAFKVAP